MSFFAELKRRNVFRVAAAYAVAGWVLIQIADAFFPALNLPDWTTRLVAGLVVLGFPVALIFAWAFEVTPEGIKREAEVEHDSAAARGSARKLDIATLIGVLMVALMFGYDRFLAPASQPTSVADAQAVVEGSVIPSIAVLAFDNMSPDPENAFFAEGISEEILNVLAGVEGLRVASRTSAFSFAGTDTPITEIATQLGVANVLEGSVRRQGMRVRITAQLIDARTDTHLWSDTYDRELTDIFAVQEEIANAITDAMRDALGVRQVSVQASTSDLAAYELFLHGRQLFFERGDALTAAIESLQSAVARDPGFADAWAYLAASAQVAPGYAQTGLDFDETTPIALDAVEHALALDPQNALALAVKAQVLQDTDGDIVQSIELLRRATALAPNDSTPVMWLGDTLLQYGYRAEGTRYLEQAYRLDPLVGIANGVLGVAYMQAGEYDRARPRLDKAESVNWAGHRAARRLHEILLGDREAVFADYIERNREDEETLAHIAVWRQAFTDPTLFDDLRAPFDADDGEPELGFQLFVAATVRDGDWFFDLLGTYLADDPQSRFIMRTIWLPELRWAQEDPRFLTTMDGLRDFHDAWATHGDPDGCVRVDGPDGAHFDCSGRYGPVTP